MPNIEIENRVSAGPAFPLPPFLLMSQETTRMPVLSKTGLPAYY